MGNSISVELKEAPSLFHVLADVGSPGCVGKTLLGEGLFRPTLVLSDAPVRHSCSVPGAQMALQLPCET